MDYKPVFENGLRPCGLHDWLQVFNYAYLMNMYFSEHLFYRFMLALKWVLFRGYMYSTLYDLFIWKVWNAYIYYLVHIINFLKGRLHLETKGGGRGVKILEIFMLVCIINMFKHENQTNNQLHLQFQETGRWHGKSKWKIMYTLQ